MRISGRDDSVVWSWDQSLHDQFPSCYFLFWSLHLLSTSFILFFPPSLQLACSLFWVFPPISCSSFPFFLLPFMCPFLSNACLWRLSPKYPLVYLIFPTTLSFPQPFLDFQILIQQNCNLPYFQLATPANWLGRANQSVGYLCVCVCGHDCFLNCAGRDFFWALDHKGVLHPWIIN